MQNKSKNTTRTDQAVKTEYPKCNKRFRFRGWDWTDVLKALGYNWEELCTKLEEEIEAKVGKDYSLTYDKHTNNFKCVSLKDPNVWSWDEDALMADVLRVEIGIAREYAMSLIQDWHDQTADQIKRAKEVIWAARKHCEAVGKYGTGYGGPVWLNLCKQDDYTFLMFFEELFTWMWS